MGPLLAPSLTIGGPCSADGLLVRNAAGLSYLAAVGNLPDGGGMGPSDVLPEPAPEPARFPPEETPIPYPYPQRQAPTPKPMLPGPAPLPAVLDAYWMEEPRTVPVLAAEETETGMNWSPLAVVLLVAAMQQEAVEKKQQM